MTVTATWTSPAAAGTLDLSAGTVVTETHWDAMVSNFLYLGGTGGTVVPMTWISGAITQNTTSTSIVAIPGVVTPSITIVGASQLIWFSGTFQLSTLGLIGHLAVRLDAGSWQTCARWTSAVTPDTKQIAFVYPWQAAAGAHTFSVGFSTSGGTIATDPLSATTLAVIDPRR